jgi:hypothetical protein
MTINQRIETISQFSDNVTKILNNKTRTSNMNIKDLKKIKKFSSKVKKFLKEDYEYGSSFSAISSFEKKIIKIQILIPLYKIIINQYPVMSDIDCPICISLCSDAIRVVCCNQLFCINCLFECLNKKDSCPLCRCDNVRINNE